MTNLERPGLDPKWPASWKREKSSLSKWRDSFGPKFEAELEYYFEHGKPEGFDESTANPEVPPIDPPRRPWEYIDLNLTAYAAIKTFELQVAGLSAAPAFDLNLALRAFAAGYTSQMIALDRSFKAFKRLGRDLQTMQPGEIPYVALGVVIGCREEAFRLARLELAAYRKRYYGSRHRFPIFFFMLRVLADFLGEPPTEPQGELLDNPFLGALFDCWRSPNGQDLVPAILAVCDFHAQRCKAVRGKMHEFDNGGFSRTPLEILLLFKLRQMLGLDSPDVDHPLMAGPLGRLPGEIAFSEIAAKPDDLVYRVRARMMEDGFDDAQIASQAGMV